MVHITLLQVPIGTSVRIVGCEGEKPLRSKLQQYGLFAGDLARLLRTAPFNGPVLIEVNGREIALGQTIAAKIIVETV